MRPPTVVPYSRSGKEADATLPPRNPAISVVMSSPLSRCLLLEESGDAAGVGEVADTSGRVDRCTAHHRGATERAPLARLAGRRGDIGEPFRVACRVEVGRLVADGVEA